MSRASKNKVSLKKNVSKLPHNAKEVLRHQGNIFYESNGVIYKKSMNYNVDGFTIVSKTNND